jgi:hypothetical protein
MHGNDSWWMVIAPLEVVSDTAIAQAAPIPANNSAPARTHAPLQPIVVMSTTPLPEARRLFAAHRRRQIYTDVGARSDASVSM